MSSNSLHTGSPLGSTHGRSEPDSASSSIVRVGDGSSKAFSTSFVISSSPIGNVNVAPPKCGSKYLCNITYH